VALLGAASLSGQVEGSKHDFSGEQAGNRRSAVCTFCHTPHRGYKSRLAWNHTESANLHSWTLVATTGGTPYPTIGLNWTGPTHFCLSCHDGSVTVGDIAWFNARSWTGGNTLDPNDHNGDNVQIGTASGDLQNNHPMAFPYPFAGVPSTYNGVSTGAAALAAGWVLDPTVNGIRLFSQAAGIVTADPVAGSTGIECSSCHDPHNNPSAVEDDPFLRGSTRADEPNYICTKCHLTMGDYRSDDTLHPHRPRL